MSSLWFTRQLSLITPMGGYIFNEGVRLTSTASPIWGKTKMSKTVCQDYVSVAYYK